jgi:hypothetical protein
VFRELDDHLRSAARFVCEPAHTTPAAILTQIMMAATDTSIGTALIPFHSLFPHARNRWYFKDIGAARR